MRIPLLTAAVLLSLSACKPIEREHTYDYDYPQTRSDLLVRWIGTASGTALWISTANDLEANGRYEGVHFLVDPGTPTEVEQAVLPYLDRSGLKAGMPVAYVVLTSPDAAALAGAERVAKEFRGVEIVSPGRPLIGSRGKKSAAPATLSLGPEVSARLLKLGGAQQSSAQALALRFIDVMMVLLPGNPDLASAMAEELGERFEKEGIPTTLVYASNGARIDEEALHHLSPEVVVGGSGKEATVQLALPKPGDVLELGTNGSEVRSPGPRTRSRYGHWLDCTASGAACGAKFAVTPGAPTLVPVKLAGQDEGLFLVDTRAPFSYLTKPRYQKIPGWEEAAGGGHSHGGGSIGLEVPAFTLAAGGRSVVVHRWHVLPTEPFDIGGKPVAGVIGMDLLQSFKLELDTREKTFAWTPNFAEPRDRLPPAEVKPGAWDVPMDRSPKGPLILATIDGEPKSLVVDLAAPQTRVYVKPDAWKKVASPSSQTLWAFDVPDEIDDAAWKKFELNAGELPVKELNLFGAKFSDQNALGMDRQVDVDVLGLDFLQKFDRVSIDFRRRSILLERS